MRSSRQHQFFEPFQDGVLDSVRDSLVKYDHLQDSAMFGAAPNATKFYRLRTFAGSWPLPL